MGNEKKRGKAPVYHLKMGSCSDPVWIFFTSKANSGVGLAVLSVKTTDQSRILMTPLQALQGLWKSFNKQFHSVLSPCATPTVYRAGPIKFDSLLLACQGSSKNALFSIYHHLRSQHQRGQRNRSKEPPYIRFAKCWTQESNSNEARARLARVGGNTNITLVPRRALSSSFWKWISLHRRKDHRAPLVSEASDLMTVLIAP